MAGHKKTVEQLIELYGAIMTLFKLFDCGEKFILFYGSLLGYHRDGQFIHNDDDIDVIVPRSCREKLLQYITDNHSKTIRITFSNDDILQLSVIDADNNKMIGPFDIYFYEEPSNSNDILIRQDGNLLFKRCDIFPTHSVIFNGHSILIPNNPAEILTELYGPDWKIPKTKNVDYIWQKITTVRRLTNTNTNTIINRSKNKSKSDVMFTWKHGYKR
jgi:phosphorylcholine metabolism protein LicD